MADNDRRRKATDTAKQQSKYSRTDDTVTARKSHSRHDSAVEPDKVTDDISPHYLAELKQSYYDTMVVVTQEEAVSIERHTQEQAMSEQWQDERRKRLTASRVGSIAKMRAKTKRSKKVKELLYSTFRGNEATRYGTELEEKTRQECITHQQEMGHQGLAVDGAGLFVSLENPWFAASPDGLVNDPDGLVNDPNDGPHPSGLVEVKTPHSIRNKPLSEACTMPTYVQT